MGGRSTNRAVRLAGAAACSAVAALAAAASLPACSSGSAGGGPGGDGGSSGISSSSSGGSAASALDGYWKRQSANIIVFNGGAPVSLGPPPSFAIPPTTPFLDDGRDTDVVEQIAGDKLVTYAFIAGNPGYFRVEQALLQAGGIATLSIPSLPASETFQMKNGQLVAQVTISLGSTQTITTTQFAKLDAFPPSGWPTLAVSLP